MNRLAVLALPLLLLVTAPARAADRTFDPDAAAKAIAPFIDECAVAVAHVDLTRVDVDAIAAWFVKLTITKPEAIAEPQKFMADTIKTLTKAGVKDIYFVLTIQQRGDDSFFAVVPLDAGADAGKIGEAFTALFKGDPGIGVDTIHKSVVVASQGNRQRLKTLKPVARPEVAKAFTAVGDGVAHAVLFAGPEVRAEIEKEVKELPADIGGGSPKVLTQGGQWAAVKVEAPPKFKLFAVVQATDKDSAKGLQQLTERFVKKITDNIDLRLDAKLLQRLVPQPAEGNRLTLTIDEPLLTEFVPPVTEAVRKAAMRAQSLNNLRQLTLSVNNIASNTTTGDLLPVANFDKEGKPLLSWRVHILPYIDQGALYKEFHLNEPWDSEHNKKLIAKMPKTYANPFNPKLAEQGKTTYLAPVHKNAMFTGDNTILRFPADITDGTSLTILFVEVEDEAAVIWTKPDDLKLDPKDPHKSLGGRDRAYFLAAYCDGAVYQLPKKIDKTTLWAYFTRNGGEKVEEPWKLKP